MNGISPEFHPTMDVIPGDVVNQILKGLAPSLIDVVLEAYQLHEQKKTINPDSYFLRYPDKPQNRIIALPAAVRDGVCDVSGIKWIASYPDNVKEGVARASAVIVLNDNQRGYPFAFMEAATISSARTAASAVLGARMSKPTKAAKTVSFIGAGIIARSIADQFKADSWTIESVLVHDQSEASATALATHCETNLGWAAELMGLETALAADVVVFATNAGTPYVLDPTTFRPGQCVLNISLRDLGPEIILGAQNIFDDVEHCLKANTSPHLAEQLSNGRDFVGGTIAAVARGEVKLTGDKPIVYSPFGMGILDLVLAKKIYDHAIALNLSQPVDNFFGAFERWRT